MNFNLINLAITIRSTNVSRLCKALYSSGGRFSDICRMRCCHRSANDCNTCSSKDDCAWNSVFGQNLTPDPAALRRYQKPSLPFVFSFPPVSDFESSSAEIVCGLVVIGQAIPFSDMLLDSFAELLMPLEATILEVGSRDSQGCEYPFRDRSGTQHGENLVVLSGIHLLDDRVCSDPALHIRLLSPLRLIEDGHLIDVFDFSRFAGSLLRRLSSLAFYYDGCEFDVDYKWLSAQAASVVCTDSRFVMSSTMNRKIAGLTGCGSFKGDFSGLSPFLCAGRYLHVGKGAAFGMGAFELDMPC